jgi:hypothetical protein
VAQQEGQSDAYLGAREAALSWLNANWDPAIPVRAWWARLADSGWAFPLAQGAANRPGRPVS